MKNLVRRGENRFTELEIGFRGDEKKVFDEQLYAQCVALNVLVIKCEKLFMTHTNVFNKHGAESTCNFLMTKCMIRKYLNF